MLRAGYPLGKCYAVLGLRYEDGGFGETHVAKDMEQAVRWYKKAADQGEPYAQYRLGGCYANGAGVAKDIEQAVQWYKKAADPEDQLGHDDVIAWTSTALVTGDVANVFPCILLFLLPHVLWSGLVLLGKGWQCLRMSLLTSIHARHHSEMSSGPQSPSSLFGVGASTVSA